MQDRTNNVETTVIMCNLSSEKKQNLGPQRNSVATTESILLHLIGTIVQLFILKSIVLILLLSNICFFHIIYT